MRIITLTALLLLGGAHAIRLSDGRYDKLVDVLENISRYSWENGTKAEAILEAKYPSYSVFASASPFPIPSDLKSDDISEIVDIAKTTLQNRPTGNVSRHQGATLLEDAAAGDPPSLGVAVLLANASTNNEEVNGVGYGTAATEQLNYLLYDVPRTSSGAISHRRDQAQLWADNVFMVPPFLAYYAVLNNNITLAREAHRQVQLYRDVLRTDTGLWAHILIGSQNIDTGLWATGNAWAAAGMLRVLATLRWSQFNDAMQSEQNDLRSWTEEILQGTERSLTSGGFLHNYMNDTSTFEESSATALLAAAALRMSTLNLTNNYVPMGINMLSAVSAKVNSSGYVTQVVDPYDWRQQGGDSAEAQSFVMMAYAAYDEWDKQGRPGNQAGENPLGDESGAGRLVASGMAVVLGVAGVLGWSLI